MKLNKAIIAFAFSFSTFAFAQDTTGSNAQVYPNTFSSGSANVSKFTQESKRFNDWAISFGVGVPLVQSADLTSIKNGNGGDANLFGYSAYVSVDKAITHAFGLALQYDRGETRQGWFDTKNAIPAMSNPYSNKPVAGRTQYDAISILGDVNFSNLLRRVDNKSPYRWAFHGYAGVGTLAYRAYQKSDYTGGTQNLMSEVKPFTLGSMFFQAGSGLKYKLNNRFDLEARAMYVMTGDDEFDGGGAYLGNGNFNTPVNLREEQTSDNFLNFTLGATLKLGKHESHLFWHDPLQELYYKIDVLADKNQDVEVCKNGDKDNDGVCDDWDRQLDTPAGARVDGAGVALDADLDGVIDLYDKCVTVPGPVENQGCPVEAQKPNISGKVEEVNKTLEGIEFELNKAVIRPSSFAKLNHAADVIKSVGGDAKFLVIGATDTRGNDALNQKLSERRAAAVVKYLEDKGVSKGMMVSEGRGKHDLKYPECDPATKCPEWKNEANRRVYFQER
ncbi:MULTISPECIES: OmpA family protein [Amniculibacterium]|jgi:OOP family OmpA-OmpF porin|uniref:OmpA family protein n=1 Tax=Amniculibacterium TaxID=2715289 RepID=UPI000F59BE0B|nr:MULTISPECIES: OmpA family protein [Amniculibacterium]